MVGLKQSAGSQKEKIGIWVLNANLLHIVVKVGNKTYKLEFMPHQLCEGLEPFWT